MSVQLRTVKQIYDDLRDEYYTWIVQHLKTQEDTSYTQWLEDEVIAARADFRSFLMTTAQVEKAFGLAEGTAKKAAQRGNIQAEKIGHDWLILRSEAMKRWGKSGTTRDWG